MCLQLKRKKYMYLSMCSCCNIVSKNPSLVKKHLLTDHSKVSAKKGFKVVIPIRINDKHVRNIRRSLDKKKMHVERNRKENKEIIESCANKENFQWGSSILCIVCKEKYDGLVSYFNHLSAKDHTNGSISFKCTNCQCCFQNLQEFVMHSKTHSGIHNLSIHNIEHVDITESCDKTIQCPYCVKLFQKTEQLHLHIGDKHVMHLKRMKVDVSVETDENVERTEKDTVLLSYNCIHCTETFPTLGSILDHISSHLPDQNVRSPRLTRKRSLPIWLQDTSFDRNVKKIKIVKKGEADAKTDKEQKLKESEVASGERSKRNNESVGKLFSGKVDDPNATQKKSVQVILPKVMLKSSTASKTEHPSKDRTCIREHFVEVLTERGKRSDVKKIRSKKNDSFQGNVRHIKANSTSFKDIQGQVSECETLSEEMAESIGKSNKLENTSQNTFNSCDSHYKSLITECFDEDVDGDSDDDYVPEQDSKESDNAVEALGDTDLYKCQYCDSATYKHEKSLKRHIKSKHLEKASESSSKIVKLHEHENDAEQNGPYRCTYCDEAEYAHTKSLRRHMRAKHPHVFWSSVNVEEAQDSVSEIETNIEGIVDKPIQGTDSRNTNSSDGDLLVKKRKTIAVKEIGSVTSVSKVKCPFCAFYLYHTEYLHSHVRKDHPEVEHFTANDLIKETVSLKLSEVDRECFQCPKCDSSYKWKNSLTCHYRRQHHKEQPLKKVQCILPATWVEKDFASAKFKCPVCNMVFIGKEALEEHTAQHMETKQCNIELRSSLPEPETVNMPRKKLMSFVCPYCDFTSPQKDTLKDHLNVHKDDTDAQILPVIKCILIKPSAFVKTGDKEHKVKECADSSAQENDNSGKNNKDKQKDQEKADKDPAAPSFNSNLRNGTYICPLCDNFKTPSKGQGVKHMELNHADKLPDIELLYVFEAFFEKGTSATKDIVRCVSCEFSSDNLTETLHHSLTEHYENRRDLDNNHSEGLEGKRIRTTKSLFKIVSMPSTDIECAEEIYKCWQCEPVHIFKTKKGCKKHMLGQHGDPVLNDVTDILNRMMDVLDVKSVKGYMCVQCKSQMGSDIDLVSHFKEKHPEEVSALEYQINTLQSQNTYLTDCECEICHKRCLNSLDLQKHLLLHKNKHTLHCPTCGIGFDTNNDMVLHCSNVHSKSTRMCNVCGKIFIDNREFLRHMRAHEEVTSGNCGKILCQHCGLEIVKGCFKKHQLRFHAKQIICTCDICTKKVKPSRKTSVTCSLCDEVFCTKFMLSAHNQKMHAEWQMEGRRRLRTCANCDIIFESLVELHDHKCGKRIEFHESEHSPDFSSVNENLFGISREANTINEKITADISANVIHETILEYTGRSDLPFTCRLCGRCFRLKKYLYCHVRRKHAEDESKRFRCKICKMAFFRLGALKTHCKNHLKPYKHECTICWKKFKNLCHLKEHMFTHTEEIATQVSCRYCAGKFTESRLKRHVTFHSKLKPYVCPFCKKGFSSVGQLRGHMDKYRDDKNISENGYVCNFCSKQFPNLHFLLKHFQKHMPQNPFKCVVCQKRFGSFQLLYSHKAEKDHFTALEIEEAKQDSEAPGRRFKIKDEQRERSNLLNDKEGLILNACALPEKGSNVHQQHLPDSGLDDSSYVEIEIENANNGQTASADVAMSVIEHVLQSMFEIDKPENDHEEEGTEVSVVYGQQDQIKFLRNEQFIQHMRDHERKTEDKNNKRLCQHCGTYISCSLFRKHLLHYHAMHITCDCEICTSQIAPTGCTPVMCKECKTVFCTKLMLNAHIKRVHTEGDFQKGEHYRTPRCVHCNIIFENTLEQHGHRCQKSHKSIRLHSTSAYADADQIEMSENTNRVGIKIPADISNNAIDENILHYNGNMDRPYSCRLCKKTFRVKKYLYYHVRTMHVDAESKRFRCRICKMGCISLATLRQHCKTHLDLRPYQCKICKKGFKSLSNLKEHFRLHDSENPQFVCMYCGCKYVQRAQLMAHVIYHSKLRPFKCPFCHKGFPTNSELKRHMDRYNNDKNIPKDNFICSYCSKQFQNHRHLLQHFFEHNPEDLFHCIVCQKRFSSFGKLYSHKVQTEHFTEKEIEEARQDAQAPGRKFKGMHKDKILYQKRKIKDETEVEAHIIDQSLEIQEHGSSVLVFDDTNYVEVQNNVDDIQTQSSKSALSLLASDALESMFEIHDPDNAVELADGEGIEEYYQQNQTKFIAESVSDLQTQADIPVISVTETGKENVFSIQNTHSDLGSRNISELAFMVAQNQEHGQPQSYQTPDGSIIHVLVVKSNTS